MSIAASLKDFLEDNHIHYDLVRHRYTEGSLQTAQAAHVPGDRLAKSVLLKDSEDYILAVLPSTYRVQISDLDNELHRDLELVSEAELEDVFGDCEPGAIPPIGDAYYVDTIVDDRLLAQDEVYIETGDHTRLVHLDHHGFEKLTKNCKHGKFSRHI